MGAPRIDGINHTSLTVDDLDASLAWYREVLGFEELRRAQTRGMDKALMARAGVVIVLVEHVDGRVGGRFDERRTGLDHLSFDVGTLADLQAWARHLDERGVTRGDIAPAGSSHLLAFRDPDGIALELFTSE